MSNSKLPPTKPTQGSLLLNESNLAWCQPNASPILVTPRPPPAPPAASNPPVQSDASQSLLPSRVVELSSTMDTLSVSDTMSSMSGSQLNLDNISSHATVGSNDSCSNLDQIGSKEEATPQTATTQDVPPVSQEEPFKEIEYHWFYQKDLDNNEVWKPFSLFDNYNLEYAYLSGMHNAVIPTNGTRFDVSLEDRTRKAVYWDAIPTQVRRCSWFYKRDSDFLFVPYAEDVANKLETTYR